MTVDEPQRSAKRVRKSARRRNHRALRLIVKQAGEITITDGTERGRQVDIIEAPEGTRIELVNLTPPNELA